MVLIVFSRSFDVLNSVFTFTSVFTASACSWAVVRLSMPLMTALLNTNQVKWGAH